MNNLENLFDEFDVCGQNTDCQGCSILEKNKPIHSVMDYETLPQADILFLSDSIKYSFGQTSAFKRQEIDDVITLATSMMDKDTVAFAASVKCPGVKESDMSPDNMNICRKHLSDTVDHVKPLLIFACGNLAMKMLLKKSGITNKRGKAFEYTTESGFCSIVVPLFHPFSIIKEPSHKYLFDMDIKNAYDMYIAHKEQSSDFKYKLITSFDELDEYNYLIDTDNPIAVDIETTGLNFLTDDILTVAISCGEDNIVLPLDHNDSPIQDGEKFAVIKWLSLVSSNPNNKKALHNSKFDQKFLLRYGIRFKNVWDTKIMHHFINETSPKGLKDLVKMYFPQELGTL